jgi:two-component system nitrogen regulation sensor histidine kinase NtrY
MTIIVTDDGSGLPPERDKVLEPYMTTRARGTGLGLAIVKKIVEEHFGEISLADADNGEGTAVTLRFDRDRLARLAGEGARAPDPEVEER